MECDGAMSMSKGRTLFMLALILILTRVSALLFFMDKLFMCEELHHGTIAKEIMEGTVLSIFEYPPTNYGHGGLWSGIFTIPFFALFGQNRFALQLTPVFFSAGIMIILFLFANKYFNRRVGIITCLLYIFSSRVWIEFSLHNGGLHFENILFTVGAMYVFYEIIFSGKDRPGYYFLLGLICGLGTYWIYTHLATVGAIILLWFLRDKRIFFTKGFYVFAAGFLTGMLPWFYYNLDNNFRSIQEQIIAGLYDEKNYSQLKTWTDTARRFWDALHFSKMLSYTNFETVFGGVYYMSYWCSIFSVAWRYSFNFRKIIFSKESFVIIFPAALLLTAAFYGFYTDEMRDAACFLNWRYVAGLFPFIFLAIAIALDRLFFRVPKLKIIVPVLSCVLISPAAVVYSRKIDFKNFGSGFKQQGYSYIYLVESFFSKHPNNLYKILDNITRLSIPQRYEVLSQILALRLEGKMRIVDFKEYLKLSWRLDEKYRPIFYRMLIKGLYYTSELPLKDIVDEVAKLSAQVEDKYRPYLYEGVGALMVNRESSNTLKYKDGIALVDERYAAYYCRGLSEPGWLEGVADYLDRFNHCMAWMDKRYQPFYLDGVGEVLAKMGVSYIIEKVPPDDEEAVVFYDFFENLDPGVKGYILVGMGKGIAYFYTVNTDKTIKEFIGNFNDDDKKIIIAAMAYNLR